jgi:beta-lactamase regulating signal transducer with metallopeptidase domain
MSLVAALFGLLLMGLRLVRGIPKFAVYVLWGTVLLRLLCPVGISSQYSLLSLIDRAVDHSFVRTIILSEGETFTYSNVMKTVTDYNPITYKTTVLEGFYKIGSVVWIMGTIILLLIVFLWYLRAKKELSTALPMRDQYYMKQSSRVNYTSYMNRNSHIYKNSYLTKTDNIYVSAMVSTPTVYGLFRPKIVLPQNMEEIYIPYVLDHEYVHIRRRDNLWRLLGIIAACIHWFNPLVWIFLQCLTKDCELACDEKIVKDLSKMERKRYAEALFIYGTGDQSLLASAFGSSLIKIRIQKVLTYKRLSILSTIMFVGMSMFIAYLLLTNGVS